MLRDRIRQTNNSELVPTNDAFSPLACQRALDQRSAGTTPNRLFFEENSPCVWTCLEPVERVASQARRESISYRQSCIRRLIRLRGGLLWVATEAPSRERCPPARVPRIDHLVCPVPHRSRQAIAFHRWLPIRSRRVSGLGFGSRDAACRSCRAEGRLGVTARPGRLA
jgi:hypothetical protein